MNIRSIFLAVSVYMVAVGPVEAKNPTLVQLQYRENGLTAPVAGVLLVEDDKSLRVLDLRLLQERTLKRASIRMLRSPATEQEVAARIGVAPVASWFIAQAVPFRTKSGRIVSVDATSAFVDLGAEDAIVRGEILDVLRADAEISDPRTGEILGPQRQAIAQAEVVDVQRQLSQVRLIGESKVDLRPRDLVRPVRQEHPVAVVPFVNSRGAPTRGGFQLAEEVTSYLSKNDMPLVERSLLDKALEEVKLAGSDRFNDEARMQVGKLLGAYALVLGTVDGSRSKANVNVRLVEVETGKVLFATTLPAKQLDMTPIGQPGSGRTTPLVRLKPFDVMRGPASFHSGHDGLNVWMHPPNSNEGNGLSRAKYRVNGTYRSLRFTAQLNATRSGRRIRDPIVFTILADDRQLWCSGPVKQQPSTLRDEVDIQGVRVLEFRVHSVGDATGAHARWDNLELVE